MRPELIPDTIGEFIRQHGENGLMRTIEIHHPPTGEIFINRLYKELNTIICDMEETASLRQDDEEDRITIDIIFQLRRTGYKTTHDTYTNGHVDIRVAQQSFVWLGEAKIQRDYDWLLKGLKQLLDRYSTGREDGSGLLIYIKGKNANGVLEEWRRRLQAGGDCGLINTEDIAEPEKLAFWSIHEHQGSGLEIRTKHIGVSLYHKPTD